MKLKKIPNNTVVHTPTEDEAKELLGLLGKVYKISAWDKYNDQLAYRVSGTIPFYANVEWYKMQKGLTIHTLAEFKERYCEEEKPQPKFEVGDWVIHNHKNREVGQIAAYFPDEECRYSVCFGEEYHNMAEHQLLPYTEPETKPTEDMETKENRNLSQDVANCDKPEDKVRKLPPPKPKTTHDEFVERATTIHNGKYSYPDRYEGCMTKLRIVCPTHGEFWQRPNAHLKGHGCWKCASERNKHLIYGVGVNDLIHSKEHRILNIWRNMLQRCYDENHRDKYPTYRGCTVHQDWHLFSNFLLWYKENNPYGFEIDKDILIPGNKEYGPHTCCALPKAINVLIRPSELRNSVSITKQGQYRVVYNLGKCRKYVETVSTYDEAMTIAKRIRHAQISELAVKYYERHEITNKVFKALINYNYE